MHAKNPLDTKHHDPVRTASVGSENARLSLRPARSQIKGNATFKKTFLINWHLTGS
jgi:hypothetical protein